LFPFTRTRLRDKPLFLLRQAARHLSSCGLFLRVRRCVYAAAMEGEKRGGGSGTSGRRLAIAIVVIGVTAGIAALYFRQFTPRKLPATQPSITAPAT